MGILRFSGTREGKVFVITSGPPLVIAILLSWPFFCNLEMGVNCVQKFLLNNLEGTVPTNLY